MSVWDELVISVTQIHGGQTWNVIPAEVTLRGTVRTFSVAVQEAAEAAMRRVIDGVAAPTPVASRTMSAPRPPSIPCRSPTGRPQLRTTLPVLAT